MAVISEDIRPSCRKGKRNDCTAGAGHGGSDGGCSRKWGKCAFCAGARVDASTYAARQSISGCWSRLVACCAVGVWYEVLCG